MRVRMTRKKKAGSLPRSLERALVKNSCRQQRNFRRLSDATKVLSITVATWISERVVPDDCFRTRGCPAICTKWLKSFYCLFEPFLPSHRTIYAEKAWFLNREKRCSEWSFSSISFFQFFFRRRRAEKSWSWLLFFLRFCYRSAFLLARISRQKLFSPSPRN